MTVVITAHDGPKNHVFPYVSTPHLVLITIMVGFPVLVVTDRAKDMVVLGAV